MLSSFVGVLVELFQEEYELGLASRSDGVLVSAIELVRILGGTAQIFCRDCAIFSLCFEFLVV